MDGIQAFKKDAMQPLKRMAGSFSPVLAVLVAFVVAGLVVLASGGNPIEAYQALAKGAFGSWSGFKNTVRYTLPIILLALSFSICNRCGYFNIGQEGQMYFAALGVAFVPQVIPTAPIWVQAVVMVAAGALFGGLISLLPAVFKFMFGVNEVVIAILMNYIILLLTDYLLNNGPIAKSDTTVPMSVNLEPSLNKTFILIAVAVLIAVYALSIRGTVPGYELRMIGHNARFAQACGVRTIKIVLAVALIGGMFSGLTAAGEVMGVYHKVYNNFAADMGFNGMTAALIGKDSTAGIIFGSLILGALQSGAVTLSVETSVQAEMVQVVKGFVMLFATINILRYLLQSRKKGVKAV
ncbi:ABC transporter permease [Anaerotruncus colihominis]|uniref:Branched-chain amino acid ABC transporter, permease protein n=2 Tax=Anaerotruncus colihominis TaxID=169435 RepID=B0PG74_9FIRM|nr:ABC transporter permease [Anaerotruncus colihominis]EDS09662.1 branched-chain amino acid ABC transporter, permease protein [Anaerotruncus colihominis DSM 17241]OUO68410.1 ABC transporter permease [Anaerotruncus colihominis]OUP68700.1 ABC transporter permease [Anaerotruncus colihominis]OUP73566.1 ABC transporter permease [Anaerotruncus colihominis]UOX64113.1 ABC transporter permease [Anaerotruncus colihominis]